MRFIIALFCIVTAVLQTQAALPNAKRILFLGDSITYGGGYIQIIEAAAIAQYPDQKIEMLNVGLASETVSGLSEEGHASGQFPRPDLHERLDRVLSKVKPDLVVACYGMNDGIYRPYSNDRAKAFQDGMKRLHDKVAALGVRIIHMTPPVFDALPIKDKLQPAGADRNTGSYAGYDEVLRQYSEWLLSKTADGWEVLDLHETMGKSIHKQREKDPQFFYAKDGIHPNFAGHLVMAQPLLKLWGLKVTGDGAPNHVNGPAILAFVQQKQTMLRDAWLTETGHKRPGVPTGLPHAEAETKAAELDTQARTYAKAEEPMFPGKVSTWNGYTKYDFTVDGKSVLVVVPKKPAPGRPWVWHGEFFGHKPAPDIALLGKGFCIAYMNVQNMLGSPTAVKHWNAFYKELTTRYGLSAKPALVGLSRGGLYTYNWAIANPAKVSCLYEDAPVCDFKSWPGGKGKGKGDKTNWGYVLKLWNFRDEAEAMAAKVNPIDNLEPLAKNHVPLLHVYGDADDVVPADENTLIVAERYKALGGDITLIAKPGVGHHPHGLEDSTPIVEFILKHAGR